MAQIRLEPPEAFNFRRPDDWPRWKQRFHQFRIASGLAAETAVQTLLYCMGEEAEAVLSSTDITEDEKKVYDTVLDKVDGYFKVRKNVIFERARFNRRNQPDGESTTSYSIINAMKAVFARFGIPELLVSDNGPQYTSQEFNHFAKQYGFTQVTSSPYYPQGNGQAERTVQTVKRLLKENEDIHLALLNYRSTPFAWCGMSPAELLMGRRIRPALPTLTNNLIPGWEFLRDFQSKNKEFKERQRQNYNKHHGVRPLSPLPESTHVQVTSGGESIQAQVINR